MVQSIPIARKISVKSEYSRQNWTVYGIYLILIYWWIIVHLHQIKLMLIKADYWFEFLAKEFVWSVLIVVLASLILTTLHVSFVSISRLICASLKFLSFHQQIWLHYYPSAVWWSVNPLVWLGYWTIRPFLRRHVCADLWYREPEKTW